MVTSFILIVLAGILMGSFMVPGGMVRDWKWEHLWAVFSLLAMLVMNWAFALILIPQFATIYEGISRSDLLVQLIVGAAWGLGAILFGMGMDKLGISLGYPIIMGLTASLGALIPMIILFPNQCLSHKGLATFAGTALAVSGIIVCARAGSKKDPSQALAEGTRRSKFAFGLVIAILAGIASGLPNIGLALAKSTVIASQAAGVSAALAGNVVWVVFFTIGSIVNLIYCLGLIVRRRSWAAYVNPQAPRNFLLGFVMSLLWISSFYLYGAGVSGLGPWGPVLGWPIFITVSIGVGMAWGFARGEWTHSKAATKRLFAGGVAVILLAVISLAGANLL